MLLTLCKLLKQLAVQLSKVGNKVGKTGGLCENHGKEWDSQMLAVRVWEPTKRMAR